MIQFRALLASAALAALATSAAQAQEIILEGRPHRRLIRQPDRAGPAKSSP